MGGVLHRVVGVPHRVLGEAAKGRGEGAPEAPIRGSCLVAPVSGGPGRSSGSGRGVRIVRMGPPRGQRGPRPDFAWTSPGPCLVPAPTPPRPGPEEFPVLLTTQRKDNSLRFAKSMAGRMPRTNMEGIERAGKPTNYETGQVQGASGGRSAVYLSYANMTMQRVGTSGSSPRRHWTATMLIFRQRASNRMYAPSTPNGWKPLKGLGIVHYSHSRLGAARIAIWGRV